MRIAGYKSLSEGRELEIRPLTVLAGANSSGKSSAMQPLLLLKQTLDAPYDPGPLLLHDSHVKFTSTDQLLSRLPGQGSTESFEVLLRLGSAASLEVAFRRVSSTQFEIGRMTSEDEDERITLRPGMSHRQIEEQLGAPGQEDRRRRFSQLARGEELKWKIVRERCFLLALAHETEVPQFPWWGRVITFDDFARHIKRIIHVPGLRGNPERAYRTTAVGTEFPGTFDQYVASVVSSWQSDKDERVKELGSALERLGLTWKVTARQLDATQVELQVGRLSHAKRGGARDLVNIADVGFGVSQCLPVIVALLTAEPGQLVYLEQPEIHLHPRAQVALAELLIKAANRGVRVVAETHSALLLLGLQSLVARKEIAPEKVKLHWFKRREDGLSDVVSADLDETGAYGDWPEDFGQVALQAESRYLDTVEAVLGVR